MVPRGVFHSLGGLPRIDSTYTGRSCTKFHNLRGVVEAQKETFHKIVLPRPILLERERENQISSCLGQG